MFLFLYLEKLYLNNMLRPEIHIVLIWEKGMNKLDHILHDLKASFDILDVVKINWDESFFSNNLSRFYGQKLPDKSFKERHCGKGSFVAVIIRHNKPFYNRRTTSKGECLVNNLLFEKKQLYRNWTGGGHRVHTSNDAKESARDIFLLLNKKVEDYSDSDIWAGNIRILNSNIQGFSGWKNFDEFFNFINTSSEYIILRNYENIELMNLDSSDIDFLTSDIDFMYSINGVKKHNDKNRAAYSIRVGGNSYNIDIRLVDDRYYDSNWVKNMLSNKIIFQDKFFIPDRLNEFYSLLYHSLIHKNKLSDKYNEKLSSLSLELGLNFESSIFRSKEKSNLILNNFLIQNQYEITRPKDFSVQYNHGRKGFKRYLWEMIGRLKND